MAYIIGKECREKHELGIIKQWVNFGEVITPLITQMFSNCFRQDKCTITE